MLFRVGGIGTGNGFWQPIPVGLRGVRTLQLPDTNRMQLLMGGHDLLLKKIVVLASPYLQSYGAHDQVHKHN